MQGTICWEIEDPFKKRHSNYRQEVNNLIGGLGHNYGEWRREIWKLWLIENFIGNTSWDVILKMGVMLIAGGKISDVSLLCRDYDSYVFCLGLETSIS